VERICPERRSITGERPDESDFDGTRRFTCREESKNENTGE